MQAIGAYLPAQLGVSKKIIPGLAHVFEEILGFFADKTIGNGGNSRANLDRIY